ncbi:unnamed protein product [Pleuronectes platessa]|uniref:Uncharacterized protein n=1 Tax=Pleuronectes platessa TaxID=8262 RepID=A0A9N7VZP6_PLEPL|nr:unnamed protein product [Pleuronectes platessa]
MRAARKALRGAAERPGEGVPRWRRRSYLSVSTIDHSWLKVGVWRADLEADPLRNGLGEAYRGLKNPTQSFINPTPEHPGEGVPRWRRRSYVSVGKNRLDAETIASRRGVARRFSVRCDRHKGLTWEWMGARGLALRLRHALASLPRPLGVRGANLYGPQKLRRSSLLLLLLLLLRFAARASQERLSTERAPKHGYNAAGDGESSADVSATQSELISPVTAVRAAHGKISRHLHTAARPPGHERESMELLIHTLPAHPAGPPHPRTQSLNCC